MLEGTSEVLPEQIPGHCAWPEGRLVLFGETLAGIRDRCLYIHGFMPPYGYCLLNEDATIGLSILILFP